jgi:hypothetical protein
MNTWSRSNWKRIHLFIYGSIYAPWQRFQFLNAIQSWLDSSDGGSARAKAATYTQNHTKIE